MPIVEILKCGVRPSRILRASMWRLAYVLSCHCTVRQKALGQRNNTPPPLAFPALLLVVFVGCWCRFFFIVFHDDGD